ncbi:cytochrome P450 [Trichoderma guizhouense]|uniref:Cytochrome P450 n=1 Tax=Trichoderma guizhouense TaxID=1491466 RepID=A0A1T3CKU8_9HYPO|nr:cytochrome P450 [Trichoderma guizhouense]
MIVYLLSVALLLLILEPLFTYYWDSKKLRRFPNASLLSGISDIGYILKRYRGFRSKEIHENHQEHPVVRVGPNTLSFSTPDAIRAIYGHNTPCLKGGTYVTAAGTHPSLLDVVDKQEHARKRRILSHAFATRNLEQWEFKVTDKVQKLVAQFDLLCHDKEEAVVDFRMWSNLFTIEAIADIALSHHLGCLSQGSDLVTINTQDGEKAVNYIDCLHSGRRATSMLIWSTKWFLSWRFVLKKLPGFFQTQWHKGQGFDEMVRYLVQQRLRRHENGEQLEDFVGCLFQDKHGDARNLEIAEIEAEVATLLDAGSDTTAISLTHAMYFLMKNPSALSRLREELRVALDGSQEIAKYATVKNLPYLHACINESLRLLPPVAFGLNRMTPPEGLVIDDTWIPGNTLVGVPAYTAHRSRLFSNSEQYQPERWLEDSIKETQGTFIPFSTGARGCIGRNISYIEQTVLLATLVQRYDLSLVDPEGKLDHEEAFNLWPGPLPLKIRRRENC